MESLYDCVLIRFVENCFPFRIGFLDFLNWPLSNKKEEGRLQSIEYQSFILYFLGGLQISTLWIQGILDFCHTLTLLSL